MNEDVKRDVAVVCGRIRGHDGVKPREKLGDPEERKIGRLLKRLKARCGKPAMIGSTKPSERQLSEAEETHFTKALIKATRGKPAIIGERQLSEAEETHFKKVLLAAYNVANPAPPEEPSGSTPSKPADDHDNTSSPQGSPGKRLQCKTTPAMAYGQPSSDALVQEVRAHISQYGLSPGKRL